ncbi:MAG: hypothetical protein QOD39_4460, partial [Mycobacterium sp.]|nr:hypothetical protein [Mycobacterium sp.]
TVVSIFSIATSFATDAQGIANNTVTTTIAYLVALAGMLLVMKVFDGFERLPVAEARQVRRWVILADPQADAEQLPEPESETAVAVESEGQNPAA